MKVSFVDHFVNWAHDNLLERDEACEYLLGRGVSREQWDKHKIGYVAGDFEVDPYADPGHSEICHNRKKKQLWCDSCRYRLWSSVWEGEEGEYKKQIVGRRIRDGVVLPLTDFTGNCVGFQVRLLKEKSYNTFTINRRPHGYFFGIGPNISSIWSKKVVWVTEGPFDQLIIERLVDKAAIALTTNVPGVGQTRFLRRFVSTVYVCLDLDKAGRDGVASLTQRLNDVVYVNNIKYPKMRPSDKDVGDLWRRVGDVKFREYFSGIMV